MSGIHLNSPVTHTSDADTDIEFVGINYEQNRVIIRLRLSQSGAERDYTFGNQATDTAPLSNLINNVSQFAGLRVALLQYLQSKDSSLAGSVT